MRVPIAVKMLRLPLSQGGGVVIQLPPSCYCFDAHFLYYQSMSNYPNFRLSESTPVPINSDNRRSTVLNIIVTTVFSSLRVDFTLSSLILNLSKWAITAQ
jgi:hypothetical protein